MKIDKKKLKEFIKKYKAAKKYPELKNACDAVVTRKLLETKTAK